MTDDHALARDLAAQAGERLLGLRAQGGDPDVLRKAGDRLSHEFLAAALAARRPDDVVLSEEAADNPARLRARRVWIVDPLDGTREFGEPGRTDWAVHVALWEDGDLTAGAVALPAQGEVLSTLEPPARCPIGPVIAGAMSHRAGSATRNSCDSRSPALRSTSGSPPWARSPVSRRPASCARSRASAWSPVIAAAPRGRCSAPRPGPWRSAPRRHRRPGR